MQFTTSFIIAALAASANAWSFKGWANQNYSGDLVISRSGNGLVNNQCTDIVANDNRLSSFKWDRGTNIFCSMKIFDGHGCKGTVIASTTGDWNVAAISSAHDNKASSLWVDCI
ncbi:hypothetical protein BJ165DRAFT_1402286 [Panaeolus papilionaceus]|nr:hypothetical protein BJ165DRAFT_1592519 [Panaeolus papilionaceus]KAF9050591.1 hypothetical protein BJ165DRAFT_1402286 [Panaeolus papilionaceus]